MTFIEQKLKHMDLIQDVIKRMASNSFQLKAWAVTIVSAVLAMAGNDKQWHLIPVALLPIALFWGLDAYFLRMERLYRDMYKLVSVKDENRDKIDFSLNYLPFDKPKHSIFNVAVSSTLLAFYGILLLLVLALIVVVGVFPLFSS